MITESGSGPPIRVRSTSYCRISLPSLILIHSKVSGQVSENDNGEHVRQQLDEKLRSSPNRAWSPKQDELPAKGDLQACFYDHYREVTEEYDKEFLKKHDEDLNTTLVFVSSPPGFDERMLTGYQAGLFSTVPSAFIIDVKSLLQPDPDDETAVSSASSSTKPTTPHLEATFPLSHNGPGLPLRWYMSKPCSSSVSSLHSSPRS